MSDDPDPFRIRAHVPDFEAISAAYRLASQKARDRLPALLDLQYGPGERERLDIFLPERYGGSVPVHIFIHGGYWRANVKEDYAFIAETATAAGAIAIVVEYALMPDVRMAVLVEQVRRAAAFVSPNAAQWGGDAARISASGHSAGAHLASYLAARGADEAAMPQTGVAALLLVSGIYDLAPIGRSFLKTELSLTPREIADWSPLGAEPRVEVPVTLAVGARETDPFHLQARGFETSLRERGVGAELVTVPDRNHMDIVLEMGRPDTAMARLVRETIGRT